jgi:hypothetical protein
VGRVAESKVGLWYHQTESAEKNELDGTNHQTRKVLKSEVCRVRGMLQSSKIRPWYQTESIGVMSSMVQTIELEES